MVDVRRIVRGQFGHGHTPFYRSLAQILAMTIWPAASLIHLWEIWCFRAPNQVPIKRAPRAVWAALRHNVLPGEYYAYALWRDDRRANIDHYLYSNEAARLFTTLNRPSDPDPIRDKLAFFEMCKKHALPTPPVLAAFAPTGRLVDFKSGLPPEHDLFVKPRLGFAGQGAERFRWQATVFESDRGHRLRPQELGNYLSARARTESLSLLVQPFVWNHYDLPTQTNAALATARLVTGRSIEGDTLPVFGFIYFGQDNKITAQHGYVSLIDVEDGQLLSTPQDSWGTKWHMFHDHQDNTYVLPDWEAAVQHTKAAHQLCCNYVFVGWDIGFTSCGPVLLEGNANWTADEYQSLSGNPLGHTKFAEILAGQLKSLGEARDI